MPMDSLVVWQRGTAGAVRQRDERVLLHAGEERNAR